MQYKKTIIITGGLGFIGSNYLNTFVPKYPDYKFVNVDCQTAAANPANIVPQISGTKTTPAATNYTFERVDIRDLAALEAVFKKYAPTDVIHFAAESHVDVSIEKPSLFVETNITGTHNLLVLARTYKIARFHQVSTDEVYGSLGPSDAPFTSLTTLAPNSPYSASKAAADLLVRSYVRTFGLDAVITRCSNNYGPHQDLTKLIPKAISLLKAGKKVPVYGDGTNVRDWIYVGDHVDAIDLVFHKGVAGQVYNIGGNHELSNNEIVAELAKRAGLLGGKNKGGTNGAASVIEYVKDRPGHDFRYAIDASEIKKSLGWTPKVSFAEGIKKTFTFYAG